MGLTERSAHHGEVLGKDIDQAAIDGAPARHNPIARDPTGFHAKVGIAVFDEHVELFKAAFIQ